MKIRPIGAQLFHADGRTDMTKLTAAIGNFVNASKISLQLSVWQVTYLRIWTAEQIAAVYGMSLTVCIRILCSTIALDQPLNLLVGI